MSAKTELRPMQVYAWLQEARTAAVSADNELGEAEWNLSTAEWKAREARGKYDERMEQLRRAEIAWDAARGQVMSERWCGAGCDPGDCGCTV